MYHLDFENMSLIYNQLGKAKIKDSLEFITIAHIATNGFIAINNGVFGERDSKSVKLETSIKHGIKYWIEKTTSTMTIDEKHEAIIPGTLYTDTNIRSETYNMYNKLLNNKTIEEE